MQTENPIAVRAIQRAINCTAAQAINALRTNEQNITLAVDSLASDTNAMRGAGLRDCDKDSICSYLMSASAYFLTLAEQSKEAAPRLVEQFQIQASEAEAYAARLAAGAWN